MTAHLIRVVFILENLPHYRVSFFNALARRLEICLSVITAGDQSGLEYGEDSSKAYPFNWIRLPVSRVLIGSHRVVFFKGLRKTIDALSPQVVIIAGNYRFVQAWNLYALRRLNDFHILHWSHGFHHNQLNWYLKQIERFLLKIIGKCCVDGMLVYSDDGSQYLRSIGISPKRIFTFNNTLDIEGIRTSYCYVSKEEIDHTLRRFGIDSSNCLVYIGRMIKRKAPDIALQYWKEIAECVPGSQLVMIGDGPLLDSLRKQADKTVVFTGAIFDEELIGCIMKVARAVFCPGYAGLNINHAFAYGKPFVVMNRDDHSPEVAYVREGINGLFLSRRSVKENIEKLKRVMTDDKYYAQLSEGAWHTGSEFTMEKMVNQVIEAIRYVMNQ